MPLFSVPDNEDLYASGLGSGLFGGPVPVPSGRQYNTSSLPVGGLFGTMNQTPFSSQIGPMPAFQGAPPAAPVPQQPRRRGGIGLGGMLGMMGMGGMVPQAEPAFDQGAADAAARERQAALSLLDPSSVLNDPLAQRASQYYSQVLGGSALPYGEKQKNLMYSRATDEIAAAQDAARRRAVARAGSMGLGRGAALAAQQRGLESDAALARQGARSDIENQATMANLQARQFASSGLGSLFGQRQNLANQLRSQAANLRASTQFRGGAGASAGSAARGGASNMVGARNIGRMNLQGRRLTVPQRGRRGIGVGSIPGYGTFRPF